MHSADWDTDNWREGVKDWKDKTVGMIGVVKSGASIKFTDTNGFDSGFLGHTNGASAPAVRWETDQFRSGEDLACAPFFCRDAF
ncbi:hypothetical protein J3R83DRAFT_5745 [Lanmaoa asiatica]|nr:hypothetical protein J3R83DRAFT_5745 [Lanmaoa asiatica]